MSMIEKLRDAMPPHYGKCKQAADALEALLAYAAHDAGCSGYRDAGESCSCGLTALLSKLGEE